MPDKFSPVSDIDPNVWYHISEARVDSYSNDFSSNLHLSADAELEVFVIKPVQQWQFHPVNLTLGRYSLRLSLFGPYKQLAVCYDAEERDPSKTKPCMMDSVPGEEAQMWEVADWGGNNRTVRFTNVRNGTDAWLDVHQGNPPFMATGDEIEGDIWKPAQRWLYTSVGDVNDEQYSTVFSAIGSKPSEPKTTTSANRDSKTSTTATPSSELPSPSEASSSQALPTGGAVAIGIASALFVVALAILGYWLLRRRRSNVSSAASDISEAKRIPSTTSPDTGPGSAQQLESPYWGTANHSQWQASPGAEGYTGQQQAYGVVNHSNSHVTHNQQQRTELGPGSEAVELDAKPKAGWAWR